METLETPPTPPRSEHIKSWLRDVESDSHIIALRERFKLAAEELDYTQRTHQKVKRRRTMSDLEDEVVETPRPKRKRVTAGVGVASGTSASDSGVAGIGRDACILQLNSSASVASTVSSRRSKSPTKMMSMLTMVDYPIVDARDIEFTIKESPAPDVKDLYFELLKLVSSDVPVVPREVEEDFKTIVLDEWCPSVTPSASSRPLPILQHELYTIQDIRQDAKECALFKKHESAWYDMIATLLRLIHQTHKSVRRENVSQCRALGELAPRAAGIRLDARMVDYALTLRPDPALKARTQTLLNHSINGLHTVNQTEYEPCVRNPIAVSIEVKRSGANVTDPLPQLGFWVQCWYARMHMFVPRSPQGEPQIITLPLIVVTGHQWHLLFAIDRGTGIELVSFPQELGNTASVAGVYRLLACLRALADWIESVFAEWWAAYVEKAIKVAERREDEKERDELG